MSKESIKLVARNRKARHQYHILETWEVGLVLAGSEVKALREGNASLSDAYARVENGEAWLYNMHIGPYGPAGPDAHEYKRRRKLLLHKQEIGRLIGKVEQAGLTLIPLEVYFRSGVAKLKLALARGKRFKDRREDIKRREADREIGRARKQR
ncbi:MAG: SsrA-binding protein SmpB [Gemmatimonadota bacterium]|nr:MAG: SsrA-binding protein SmpB [Gemmatimonadota bacterium]